MNRPLPGVFLLKEAKAMLDINLVRKNPDLVRENLRKKYQDHKLPLVDEVLELDAKFRATKTRATRGCTIASKKVPNPI